MKYIDVFSILAIPSFCIAMAFAYGFIPKKSKKTKIMMAILFFLALIVLIISISVGELKWGSKPSSTPASALSSAISSS